MTHLIGYARVSTFDQTDNLQTDALTKAGCYRVFSESVSGSAENRPVLAEALDHLRPGDTLVVWRLDRLGRSIRDLIEIVTGLSDRGIGFRSLQESMDTTTPGGRLIFHVFAALAEFERDIIRDRTLAGLDAARARGRVGGRPPALSAQQQKAANEMLASGSYTATAVAEVLGVGRATVYRHMKRMAAQ